MDKINDMIEIFASELTPGFWKVYPEYIQELIWEKLSEEQREALIWGILNGSNEGLRTRGLPREEEIFRPAAYNGK